MSDWAEECTDRWHESVGLTKVCKSAIEGAVREALAKAAEVVEDPNAGLSTEDVAAAIRALGAAR